MRPVIGLCSLAMMTMAMAAGAVEATSPETRAEMIRLIDNLEKHPGDPNSGEARSKVLAWLTEAPDVSVNVCGQLIGGLEKYKEEQGGDLLLTLMFSEARFILENPDKASDDNAVHLAGVEGTLRTYSAMKAEDPKLKLAPLEALAKLQAEQKLAEHVAKVAAKCH